MSQTEIDLKPIVKGLSVHRPRTRKECNTVTNQDEPPTSANARRTSVRSTNTRAGTAASRVKTNQLKKNVPSSKSRLVAANRARTFVPSTSKLASASTRSNARTSGRRRESLQPTLMAMQSPTSASNTSTAIKHTRPLRPRGQSYPREVSTVTDAQQSQEDLILESAIAAAAMERQHVRMAQQLSIAEQQLASGTMTPRTVESIELAIALSLSEQDTHMHVPFQSSMSLADSREPDLTYESLVELEDVAVGLSPNTIAALPSYEFQESDFTDKGTAKSCPICITDFTVQDRDVVILPCDHLFHRECIATWLQRSKKCCVCKYVLDDR